MSRFVSVRRWRARAGDPEGWTEVDLDLSTEIVEFLDYAGAAGPDYQRLGAQRASASQRLRGEEHPTTLKALGDFAVMLYAQGDLEQAATITEKVLELETRVLGADDLSTVVSMSNLAQILRDRGDYERCQHLMHKVIAIETQQLGRGTSCDPDQSAQLRGRPVRPRRSGYCRSRDGKHLGDRHTRAGPQTCRYAEDHDKSGHGLLSPR